MRVEISSSLLLARVSSKPAPFSNSRSLYAVVSALMSTSSCVDCIYSLLYSLRKGNFFFRIAASSVVTLAVIGGPLEEPGSEMDEKPAFVLAASSARSLLAAARASASLAAVTSGGLPANRGLGSLYRKWPFSYRVSDENTTDRLKKTTYPNLLFPPPLLTQHFSQCRRDCASKGMARQIIRILSNNRVQE
jgi:hypothetical protein